MCTFLWIYRRYGFTTPLRLKEYDRTDNFPLIMNQMDSRLVYKGSTND